MKLYRLTILTLLACATFTGAQAEETVIKFSDPKKPGTLRVQMFRGDIRVRGADVTDVTVRSDAAPAKQPPGKDGMRVISTAGGFYHGEKDNVITIDSSDGMRGGGGADFTIVVPRSTNIIVSNSVGGGDVSCSDISGDLEIEALQGEVQLRGISGGAIVSTINGEIEAAFTQVSDKKPLSFSSLNGKVELQLPVASKANIRLSTQNGTIRTNFDEAALITKVEAVAGPAPRPARRGGTRTISTEVETTIRETAQATIEAVHEAKQAAQEGIAAARAGIDAARQEMRRSEDERRSADVRIEDWNNKKPAPAVAPAAPAAPMPPKPPIARMTSTGGKLVTGTLNGGGPEISIATMNGDVTLRKIDGK